MTVAVTDLISNNASKFKLLFVHGFMAGPSSFAPLLACLEQRGSPLAGLSAAAVTLPGHDGEPLLRRSTGQPWQVGDYTRSLAETLNRLGGDKEQKLILYGYSMGGRLALQALLAQTLEPSAVSAVILESASFGLSCPTAREQRLAQDAELFAGVDDEASFRRFLTRWYRLPLFRGIRAAKGYDAMIAARLRQDPRQLQLAVNQLSVGHQPDMREGWLQLSIPKLYLAGEWDLAYRQQVDSFAEGQKPWQKVVIPEASHNAHMMAPSAVADAVSAFLLRC